MKTEVLTPKERVFTGPKGELKQGVFVRLRTYTVCIATLLRSEAMVMRDIIRQAVSDASLDTSTKVCFHTGEVVCELKALCHKLDTLLTRMTPSTIEGMSTSSSFTSDQSIKEGLNSEANLDGRKERDIRIKYQNLVYHAMNRLEQCLGIKGITVDDFEQRCDELVTKTDLKVGPDFSEKTQFGLKDVPEMPDIVDDHVSDAGPKSVFKGVPKTKGVCPSTVDQRTNLQPETVLNSSIEVGDGLSVPVHAKLFVSPKGLASSCNCSWLGCQHPSHGTRSESCGQPTKSVRSPGCRTVDVGEKEKTSVTETELREAEDAYICERCKLLEGRCQDVPKCPPRAVPTAKSVGDTIVNGICACERPDSCSHPSHVPGFLEGEMDATSADD